jgi:hypothetical protein
MTTKPGDEFIAIVGEVARKYNYTLAHLTIGPPSCEMGNGPARYTSDGHRTGLEGWAVGVKPKNMSNARYCPHCYSLEINDQAISDLILGCMRCGRIFVW